MAKRDIIVIGSSAGGVYALQELVGQLPADFSGSIFVVQHLAPYSPSLLPAILTRCGPLKVVHPHDGEAIKLGCIYIAPPDHHLLIEKRKQTDDNVPDQGEIGYILVRKGPKENRFRPSIDALFRSAAYSFGPRVIGVVLTGLLNDGTSGMWTIKRLGGLCIVQKPEDALYASMPESVLEYVEVDSTVPLADLGLLLSQLTQETVPEPIDYDQANVPDATVVENELNRIKTEVDVAAQANAFNRGILSVGELTPLTCPECRGTLVSFREGQLVRYRCHTGHSYTASTLLVDVTRSIEDSMWITVRSLEESIMLLDQAADQLAKGGQVDAADEYQVRSAEAKDRVQVIRDLIFSNKQLAGDGVQPVLEGND